MMTKDFSVASDNATSVGASQCIVPVILAGGIGRRLWPVSHQEKPKQFAPLGLGGRTLFFDTLSRFAHSNAFQKPLLVCAQNQAHEAHLQAKAADFPLLDTLLEPCSRNTGPAVLAAALYLEQRFGAEALMLIAPSDHRIESEAAFCKQAIAAAPLAQSGRILCFGIEPTHPETGYGYIERGDQIAQEDAFVIKRFHEKPALEKAQQYLNSGNFLWNSGIFLASVETILKAFQAHQPDLYSRGHEAFTQGEQGPVGRLLQGTSFASQKAISFDHALMEYTQLGVVLQARFPWSDLGTWSAFSKRLKMPSSAEGNQSKRLQHADSEESERVHFNASRNCEVHVESDIPVQLVGVKDLFVVVTESGILISHKESCDAVASI